MKEYTAPQIMLCENYQELHVDPATLEWSVDSEKNQVVLISRYERLDYEEYLKEQGEDPAEYDDETIMENRAYRLRPEAVEVARVDCDQNMREIVKEGIDEEGNQIKTIVTKKQLVAFEIGDSNSELREYMGYDEDFQIHFSSVNEGAIAFRKDGRWWFLDLTDMALMEYGEYDEETDDEVNVPFSCEAIYPLSWGRPYIRGEKYEIDPEDFVGGEVTFVCEDGEAQYGIRLPYIQNGVELLNRKNWEGELNDPWTRIEWMAGNLTVRQVSDENGLKKEGIYEGLYRNPNAIYDRELEDSKPLEYEVIHGADTFVRVIQGNEMRLIPLAPELKYMMNPAKAKSPLLDDYLTGDGEIFGIKIKERVGDYFVIAKEVSVGSRKKVQYRIAFEDTYLDGTWDEAGSLGLIFKGYAPLFRVKKDGYWGIINETGTVVVPLKYQKITVDGSGNYKKKQVAVGSEDKDIVANLILDDFGQKGFGVLVANGEYEDDVKRMDQFIQIIPCSFEAVIPAYYFSQYEGIQVEKMGRAALYNYFGKLEENFKPGHADSTVF